MRKPTFCICKNKDADQLRSYSTFVFATRIVQLLYFLYPIFPASCNLVFLQLDMCRTCSKTTLLVFPFGGSNVDKIHHVDVTCCGIKSLLIISIFTINSKQNFSNARISFALMPAHTFFEIYEPPHGKTNNLHLRKQRRRSASR